MGSEITESASLTAEHDVGPGLPCGTSEIGKVRQITTVLWKKENHFIFLFFILNSTSLGDKFS